VKKSFQIHKESNRNQQKEGRKDGGKLTSILGFSKLKSGTYLEGRFLTEGGALRHFKQTMTAATMRPTAAHTDPMVTAMFPALLAPPFPPVCVSLTLTLPLT